MNKIKIFLFVFVLALIGGSAFALNWLKSHQKLGAPGIRAISQPDTVVMKIDLPERVLDFTSTNLPEASRVLGMLPKDTSYVQRRYIAPDGFWVSANIVLMGMDRTSIHRPEACLPSQGFHIDTKTNVNLVIDGKHPYKLSVATWFLSTSIAAADGKKIPARGLYVFWFIAKNEETTSHMQRLWWLTRDLLTTGVLQRWAYVSYFAICEPGQQDAALERMEKLIATSVPEFQLPPDAAIQATR